MSNNTIHAAFTNSIAQGQVQKTSSAGKAEEARSNAANIGNDAATISQASSALSTAMSTDDVRMHKVSAIKTALNNGSYNVSPAAVADKMIDGLLP